MNKGILIWAEISRDDYVNPVVFELAGRASELSGALDESPVMALVMLKPEMIDKYKEAFSINGFDKVYYLENSEFGEYKTDIFSKIAVEAVKVINPEIFLIGATNQGRDIAPRISSALNTGLTADCTALDINENKKLAATRPTFGGQLMATILSKTFPQMATVRPGTFKTPKTDKRKETEFIKLDIDTGDIKSKIEILDFKKKISSVYTINIKS